MSSVNHHDRWYKSCRWREADAMCTKCSFGMPSACECNLCPATHDIRHADLSSIISRRWPIAKMRWTGPIYSGTCEHGKVAAIFIAS